MPSSPRAALSSPPRESSPELDLPGSPNGSVVSRSHPALSPPPPGSPTWSLHSGGSNDQQLAREAQRLIPEARGDDESDGNVSDLVARANGFAVENQADFFAQLLARDELDAGLEPDFEAPVNAEDIRSPEGSDVGVDGINFGLPGADEDMDELPRFHFDEELEEPAGNDPGDDTGSGHDAEPDFAAFEEPGVIQNAYVDAFVQKTRFHATHEALKHQLKSARRTISANPDISQDGIDKMAQTMRTAEKRLGLSTSNVIKTYTLCPVCKRRYDPAYIADADQLTCINDGCIGVLFTNKILASGDQRRVSNSTYPVGSLKAWLQRVLLQPGMAELLQNWRTGPDDHEEMVAPISADEWKAVLDENAALGDIPPGYAWRERHAAMERVSFEPDEVGGRHMAWDCTTLDHPLRFSSLHYGLSLSMNTDW
ncbi:hypothetical protein FRC08_005926 [Ceratobasidium sp. 394]|nr:hypothetical protein FRC08_005926 [Ceratobasidium sp. 394]